MKNSLFASLALALFFQTTLFGQVSFEISGTVIKNEHGFRTGQKVRFLFVAPKETSQLKLGHNGGHFYIWSQEHGAVRAPSFWSHLAGTGLRGALNQYPQSQGTGVMMYNWAGLDLSVVLGLQTPLQLPNQAPLEALRIYGFLEGFQVGDMRESVFSLQEYFSPRVGTYRYVKDQGGFINNAPNVGGSFLNPETVTISTGR